MKAFEQLISSSVYLLSSMTTTLVNKYILSDLQFEMQYLLVMLQSLTIVCSLLILRRIGVVDFELTRFKKWMVPSLLLTVMIFSGSKSLYYLPISIYTLFKNCSIVITALLEKRLFNRKISTLAYTSFMLMIGSSYIGDSSEAILAIEYGWMLINIVSTTAYVLSLKIAMDTDSRAKTESVYYSNLVSLPILAPLSFVFDNKSSKGISTEVIAWVFVSSVCAFFTSFSTAWTLNVLSSTTLGMLGALNKSFGSFLGIIVLNESINAWKAFSLLLGSVSVVMYSYGISYEQK
ncbi:nucleotide sugar transporter [Ordospora colligata]|uniref:GDP-mannose transporter n=1 Tax=Ordospora colligata OC4 TaxID=1354746 RepID=A0A0B2UG09_9MICR|nr:nucleotide sugar transporter [Ordospora colligata OC4]KHN70026.1 nucleotide sugar transporter [Ordospora colligata OC4]TBU16408.1 nucleotide sugar transporter [Ordospora colligata]TBU16593.1 nucleotide sugar transporter [Ordospora colligata]TBU19166.1 nucleotide sugar transporter [Ordospora colligata]